MIYIVASTMAVITGAVMDLIFPDPQISWHPICLIGSLIHKLDELFRVRLSKNDRDKRIGGVFLVMTVMAVTILVSVSLTVLCYRVHTAFGFLIETAGAYFALSTRTLAKEAIEVKKVLEYEGIESARKQVSRIVGRDTDALDEAGVIRATVETVAENGSDGCIAPLFYLMIGGAAGGFLYKAVNTMDSMLGYKNETYLVFGKAAAKVDDFFNFLPSRISALLLLCVSAHDARRGWRIFKRDRYHHASPNSAQTEAAMAGILGIELGGDAHYFGTLYKKQKIGDALRPVERADIGRAVRLLYRMQILGIVLFGSLKGLILLCISMVG